MALDLQSLPKAELHVHLEGSITPHTACLLDPSLSVAEVERRYQYTDFRGFLDAYKWITGYLRRPEDYAVATRSLLETLAAQNVQYLELNLSVGVMLLREQDVDANLEAIFAAAAAGPMPVRFLLDAVRHFGVDHTARVAAYAVKYRERGVVGFGIGGDELRGPARLFRELFAETTAAGLAAVPHAGETDGPQSIWDALELGAVRIGHGFRAIEDPLLVAHLRDRRIPLEICLSSNLATRTVESLAAHPARRLYDAGVPITLNTDDPAMFHTTLTREYELARTECGFADADLAQIAAYGFQYALERESGVSHSNDTLVTLPAAPR
jgi:adenosine deaminase/aminodeoxyfutalosine deaminase